jgi:hypothetical protein
MHVSLKRRVRVDRHQWLEPIDLVARLFAELATGRVDGRFLRVDDSAGHLE